MSTPILTIASQLSDPELVAQVKVLAQKEREATGALIAHLSVLDERRLYLAEGCSSMFTYCMQVLHLSEYAAYSRIEAARAVRKYPVILDMLSNGSVNLTTLGLLVPELTSENHLDLLERAGYKSRRQVQELVAGLRPRPPVPSSIRRLPAPHRGPAPVTTRGDALRLDSSDKLASLPAQSPTTPSPAASLQVGPAPSPTRPAIIAPLAAERYEVQFTASAQTCEKMRLAQDLLRHQVPDGDLGEVIDRALTVLLKELTRQKFAGTDRPRETRDAASHGHGPVPGSRHIPAEVKRTVWIHDGGRCAFVAQNGRRCTERTLLEFHHVVPHGVGGEPTVDNIQLRCRAHNRYEAEVFFGKRATLWKHQTSVNDGRAALPAFYGATTAGGRGFS